MLPMVARGRYFLSTKCSNSQHLNRLNEGGCVRHIVVANFLSGRSVHCKEFFHLGRYLARKLPHFLAVIAQPRSGRKD